jgi:hypothetical protein
MRLDEDPDRGPIGFGRDQEAVFGLQAGDCNAIGSTTSARANLGRLWTDDRAEFRLPDDPETGQAMSEDHRDTHDPADTQDPREDYVVPTLTDLGSFQELTRFGGTGASDIEGQS